MVCNMNYLDKEEISKILPNDKGLEKWNLLLAYRGSVAHNLYIPSSEPNSTDDVDLIGICIPSLDYYFGLKTYGSRGTVEIKENNLDIVIFEFKKLIQMLSGCNPNVLSLLWTKPEHFLNITRAGQMLIDNRDLFLSKQVYEKFGGYAKGQLAEMTKGAFKGFMGTKRKELVNKFGFDPKNASHLIRLLRMGDEILRTGQVNVWREDRDELLSIKRGEWTLEQIKAESDRLFIRCEESSYISKLPERTDMDKINQLSVDIIKEFFNYE